MSNKQQKEEQLLRYLDGELEGAELVAFEEQLVHDAKLRAQFDSFSLARLAIQHYGLKAQVAAVRQNMMAEFDTLKKRPKEAQLYPLVKKLMRFAAAILLFVIAFSAYETVVVTSAGLSKETYLKYDLNVLRGTSETTLMELAYNNHDYNKALILYKSIMSPGIEEQFIAAQSYLVMRKPADAIKEFRKVLAKVDVDDTYREDAQYYLGVSYLANNQPAMAEPILEKIHEDKFHLYHSKVTYWTLLRLKLLVFKSRAD
ncbi:hypothetical protein [Mucilaginibacter gossypii]|uniref:Tetratricopeptide repeat protein n=1 Tax=Mucilaginibacter gossypii TaxID=551996 RepID=A0A1G8N4G9_9SPHI|nr:hypothetical protein [Mucilaginibacter gossypii]SDI75082.1 hypothetical protein SAMN05192573_13111 [Mucilaginibacter gossypii]